MKSPSKSIYFHSSIWKCRLENGGHLSRPQCVNQSTPCGGKLFSSWNGSNLHGCMFGDPGNKTPTTDDNLYAWLSLNRDGMYMTVDCFTTYLKWLKHIGSYPKRPETDCREAANSGQRGAWSWYWNWGYWKQISNHRNGNVVIITTFVSLAALEVIIATTPGVANDENVIKMTILFQWIRIVWGRTCNCLDW